MRDVFKLFASSSAAPLGAACLVVLACQACKPSRPTATLQTAEETGPPVDDVHIEAKLGSDSSLQMHASAIKPAGVKAKITSVEALEAELKIEDETPKASTSFIDIGELRLESAVLKINAVSHCVQPFAAGEEVVRCINPATPVVATPTPTPTSEPAAPAPTLTASDFKTNVIYHPKMKCGDWYNERGIWQKSFDVEIEGSAQALDAVEKVSHAVYNAYRSGPFVSNDRATKFATKIGFATKIKRWTLDPSTVYLKDGRSFALKRALVEWKDEDPDRPAGDTCTRDD